MRKIWKIGEIYKKSKEKKLLRQQHRNVKPSGTFSKELV